MALQYFDPVYKLTIGDKPWDLSDNDIYKNSVLEGVSITDFNIDFDVKNTSTSSSNTAEIIVHNPPRAFLDSVKRMQGKKQLISLEAGFKRGKTDILFFGVITGVKESNEGIDKQLSLTCSDGSPNIKQGITKRTYPRGVPLKTIMDDLRIDLALTYGYIVDLGINIPREITLSGNTYEVVESLSKSIGAEVNIQQGKLYVLKPSEAVKTKLTTKISPETGLVGSITVTGADKSITIDDSLPKNGISFKCLLNGAIQPSTYVEVVYKDKNLIYKVSAAEHKGSYEGNEWFTYVTCTEAFLEVTE